MHLVRERSNLPYISSEKEYSDKDVIIWIEKEILFRNILFGITNVLYSQGVKWGLSMLSESGADGNLFFIKNENGKLLCKKHKVFIYRCCQLFPLRHDMCLTLCTVKKKKKIFFFQTKCLFF